MGSSLGAQRIKTPTPVETQTQKKFIGEMDDDRFDFRARGLSALTMERRGRNSVIGDVVIGLWYNCALRRRVIQVVTIGKTPSNFDALLKLWVREFGRQEVLL